MSPNLFLVVLLGISALAYRQGKKKAFASVTEKSQRLHSLPNYYGVLTALWCFIPAILIFLLWQLFSDFILTGIAMQDVFANTPHLSPAEQNLLINDMRNMVAGVVSRVDANPLVEQAVERYLNIRVISHMALGVIMLIAALIPGCWIYTRIKPEFRARNHVEQIVEILLILCSTVAILTTVGIVLSVLFESIRFFQQVPLWDFLFGLKWSPQMAIRADQAGSSGSFGAVPVFAGTFMISGIALAVAVPIGLMSAIYLSEYAGKKLRAVVKPLLEILAGVPTVVYGFFAALVVAPLIRDMGLTMGMSVSSESALAAGLVMGIMIIPFVSSLSDDVINAVPQSLRDGSYGLGATKSETIKNVIIPAALPGIVGSILLAASRAIGETMIVVMAAGLSANLTANPLEAVTTVTVQIVTLLVGDQEFDSPKTLAAFALGLLLFVTTLMLNVVALYVVRKYREEYE
ncbi:phosphate ABC transporter permease subunit PstC [Desulfogranum japonicum]|uniref:phosphate ABC transporter permease subunit PstC n=1 Tax=Desulfogranum japonicum TaxID=231447 RepID=UPI00040D1B32|nr:phosphate ABC transporter permease subunit PstC [Desulfogranum japonicum]